MFHLSASTSGDTDGQDGSASAQRVSPPSPEPEGGQGCLGAMASTEASVLFYALEPK